MEKSVWIKAGKSSSVLRRHPWLFSGAIAREDKGLKDGDWVVVRDEKDVFLGAGHFFKGSIAVKMLIFSDEQTLSEADALQIHLEKALDMRKKHPQFSMSSTYRLCHGEGDRLPGLIIDVYGETAVVQCHSPGMHRNKELIASFLQQACWPHVYDKSKETLPETFASQMENSWLLGGTELSTAEEHGILFEVDPVHGQKTGFFLDQRDNRLLLSRYCREASVLNTFCYTGGFSMMALKGGAKEVISVDVSARALETLEKNLRMNPELNATGHLSVKADAKEYLKNCEQSFDVIVLDPPAYAKHMGARHKAVQAYRRLNAQGLRLLNPGGILFTFSCSQVVDAELFYGAVTAAAIDSGRNIRILHWLSQSADHPVNIYHPEGRYLKGLVLYVE